MKVWLDRILLISLVAIILVLAGTALPVLFGGHLQGNTLLIHMVASGAFVFALPISALIWMWRNLSRQTSGGLQRLGFWALIVSGLLTILTVFTCMLPIASTEQMQELIEIHGYAGFAMVPALLLLVVGAFRWRRTESIRSETPG